MKKQIGLMGLAVLTAFTIGFAPGLAQAGINFSPIYEGHFQISGTVQESYPGYVLKSSKGTFHLAGADASKWVGQKVKAWGELSRDETTDVETLNVERFAR